MLLPRPYGARGAVNRVVVKTPGLGGSWAVRFCFLDGSVIGTEGMNRELRQRLIEAARSEDEFVHYDEVADILGICHDRLDHSYEMNHALEEISTYEQEHGRPMLTAVVVHKDDMMPGKGFFELARRLDKLSRGQDADEFYFAELAAVRRYWGEHTDGEVEQGDSMMSQSESPTRIGSDTTRNRFRVVFKAHKPGRDPSQPYFSERFQATDNAVLICQVTRQRRRLLPLALFFRTGSFRAELRDARTDKIAKRAMKEGKGVVDFRGHASFFGCRTSERRRVIQNGGSYYLKVSWGSLVKSWEVSVVEPLG